MKIVPWVRPALIGPFLGMTAFVTITVLIGWTDPLFGGRLGNWAMGMLYGGLVAGAISAVLLAADLSLLRLKARRPPTGLRAWGGAVAAPLLVFAIYLGFWPGDYAGTDLVFALLVPVIVVGFAIRYLTGEPLPEA